MGFKKPINYTEQKSTLREALLGALLLFPALPLFAAPPIMADTLTREERSKKRADDEARKNGELAPETDNDGNLINPHIPEYMSKAPWYLQQEDGAGLKHQRMHKFKSYDNKSTFHDFAKGGRRKGAARGNVRVPRQSLSQCASVCVIYWFLKTHLGIPAYFLCFGSEINHFFAGFW